MPRAYITSPSVNSKFVVSQSNPTLASAAMATTDPHPPPPVADAPTKKPSILSTLWQKLGLDVVTLILMAK